MLRNGRKDGVHREGSLSGRGTVSIKPYLLIVTLIFLSACSDLRLLRELGDTRSDLERLQKEKRFLSERVQELELERKTMLRKNVNAIFVQDSEKCYEPTTSGLSVKEDQCPEWKLLKAERARIRKEINSSVINRCEREDIMSEAIGECLSDIEDEEYDNKSVSYISHEVRTCIRKTLEKEASKRYGHIVSPSHQ